MNNWQFIACTYDGNNVYNYVNGNLISSYSLNGLIDSCIGGDLRFGYAWNSYPFPYTGLMDDIVLYNRALTPCEILQIYNQNSATISQQPQNQTAIAGNNVPFSVTTPGTGLSYQWQQNSGTGFVNLSNAGGYSGVTTNTLTITGVTAALNNNLYRCIVSGTNVCNDTSSNAVLMVTPNGVNEIDSYGAITIAPNPTSNTMTIKTTEKLSGKKFLLFNEMGQSVITGVLERTQTEVDMKPLAKGMYYLRIEGMTNIHKMAKY